MKKWLVALTVGALSLGSAFAMGDKPSDDGCPYKGKGRGHHRMMKELDLSKEQVEKIQAIKEKYYEGKKEHRERKHEERDELTKLMQAPTKGESYNSMLREKHDELLKKGTERRRKHFEMMLQIRELLNGDQLKKFKGLKLHKRGHGKGGCMGKEECPKKHGGHGHGHGHGQKEGGCPHKGK